MVDPLSFSCFSTFSIFSIAFNFWISIFLSSSTFCCNFNSTNSFSKRSLSRLILSIFLSLAFEFFWFFNN
ncbi:hypothetical protein SCLARK_001022 [Spiroplasma clarkii]|nr:hypothetical protein SCLARK_001022 [Spiroplasma clarkii]